MSLSFHVLNQNSSSYSLRKPQLIGTHVIHTHATRSGDEMIFSDWPVTDVMIYNSETLDEQSASLQTFAGNG